MPCRPHSLANAFVSPATACLLAVYAGTVIPPLKASNDAMLMILPDPRATMSRPKCWQRMKVASRLVRRTTSQSAREYSTAACRRIVPALLTRMSIRPASSSTSVVIASSAARSPRSATTSHALRPNPSIAATVSRAPPARVVAQTTSAPAPASASAIARPSPRLAPVTSARCP